MSDTLVQDAYTRNLLRFMGLNPNSPEHKRDFRQCRDATFSVLRRAACWLATADGLEPRAMARTLGIGVPTLYSIRKEMEPLIMGADSERLLKLWRAYNTGTSTTLPDFSLLSRVVRAQMIRGRRAASAEALPPQTDTAGTPQTP